MGVPEEPHRPKAPRAAAPRAIPGVVRVHQRR